MNENNIIGVILAGGKSKRIGIDKSTIKLGDKTLLQHTILKIEESFPEILIISNNENNKINNKNISTIEDCIKGQLGPLAGVLSAMKWVEKKNRKYEWIATFPCDTPFFDKCIIEELKRAPLKMKKKLIFLKSGERRHNIFGLWKIELKDILEKDLSNNFRKVEHWAEKIGFDLININLNNFDSFLNINTQEDLSIAKKHLEKL